MKEITKFDTILYCEIQIRKEIVFKEELIEKYMTEFSLQNESVKKAIKACRDTIDELNEHLDNLEQIRSKPIN